MTITRRLQKFMELKNLNANKITVDAGLSVGLIGRAIKNDSGLNSDTVEKILIAYTELNPEWFVSGNGEMLKPVNQTIASNNSPNSVNNNINGNVNGNFRISHSEFSGIIDLQKETMASLRTCQVQLSESMKQVTILLELLKK